MAGYEIVFKQSVYKELKNIPKSALKKILAKVEELGSNPRPTGCEKLTGQELYRIRQGNYRIVYSIQDYKLTVWVINVGLRKHE
ncbi:MAG: type II toxin-antitoxin system RelE/ParE family toxin [Desulfobacterales bacterium]|nr:type II toxin-antitoxin system RelE/ParE family toxin [Desulfobacterales bacterium]